MPRGPRLDAPGVLHHVMARGIEKRKIFLQERDYSDFLERLGQALEDKGAVVYAWVLLPNHFHLLIRTSQGDLVGVMRKLMTGYAVNFNLRHKRAGHLFQNRYKSVICQEEPYFMELVRYIHLNPVRLGMVQDLGSLIGYCWSGYRMLMGKDEYPWQEVEEVLGRFGNTFGESRRRLRKFMEEGVKQGKRPELMGGGLIRSLGGWEVVKKTRLGKDRIISDTRILGDGDFVSRILKEAETDKAKKEAVDLSDLVHRVSSVMGVDDREVKGLGRLRRTSDARAIISFLAVERYGIPGIEVARELGKNRASICKSVVRGRKIYQKNQWIEAKLEK